MKKRTPFIKKLIAPVLFIITVALYFNVNYTTAINLSSLTSKIANIENKEGIDKDVMMTLLRSTIICTMPQP